MSKVVGKLDPAHYVTHGRLATCRVRDSDMNVVSHFISAIIFDCESVS